uniref:Uncharacterized protein n=1 Tax=Romanomermis culicivorax TaxID=13658 RepID=A0A915ICI8_ROMCU
MAMNRSGRCGGHCIFVYIYASLRLIPNSLSGFVHSLYYSRFQRFSLHIIITSIYFIDKKSARLGIFMGYGVSWRYCSVNVRLWDLLCVFVSFGHGAQDLTKSQTDKRQRREESG